MRQEEVAVLVVIIGGNIERGGLCATFGVHRLSLWILLRNKRCGSQFAKLKFGFDTEQCGTTTNQRWSSGHAHITSFQILDNFVFLAFVSKFQVLIVEIKCRICVIRHIELHLITHRCCDGGLNLLIEIKVSFSTSRNRKRRVIGLVALHTHIDVERTSGFQLHTTRTEHRFQWSKTKLHIQEVERLVFLLFNGFGIFLAIILLHRLTESDVVVFVGRKKEWRNDVVVTNLCAHHIMPSFGVELGGGGDVWRCLQIGGRLHKLEIIVRIRQFILHTVREVKRILRRLVHTLIGSHCGRWSKLLFWSSGLGLRNHIATNCERDAQHARNYEKWYFFKQSFQLLRVIIQLRPTLHHFQGFLNSLFHSDCRLGGKELFQCLLRHLLCETKHHERRHCLVEHFTRNLALI